MSYVEAESSVIRRNLGLRLIVRCGLLIPQIASLLVDGFEAFYFQRSISCEGQLCCFSPLDSGIPYAWKLRT